MRAASTADTSRSKRQRVIAGDDDDVDDKGSDNDEDDIDAIIANAIEADGAFDDNRDVDAPDEGVANNDDNGENNDDDDAQIDLSKINTKLTAAEKRSLFALVMHREHQRLNDDVESIKGSWHMHEECLSKKTQDEVSRIVSVRLLLTTRSGEQTHTGSAAQTQQTRQKGRHLRGSVGEILYAAKRHRRHCRRRCGSRRRACRRPHRRRRCA